MRHAAKADENQQRIVEALRCVGATVEHLSPARKGGCPDLLVGYQGQNYLLEVKREKQRLNERQYKWHKGWRGMVAVVRNPGDALDVIGL